jgi:hypothetical protein
MKWRMSRLNLLMVAMIGLGTAQLQVGRVFAGGINDVGSLTYHLATNAAGHANGHANAYDDMTALSHWGYAIYSGTNLGHLTNAVWSTNFWLHGVQGLSATCIGFSNGMGGQGLITMVSPRHYLFATHMHPEDYLIVFLDTNNVIYWRKTLQRVDLTNDISVGVINEDVPASVGYLPVLPADFLSYLPTGNFDVVQGIGMNQDLRIFSQPMFFRNGPYVGWNPAAGTALGPGTNWNIALRAGDSSDPDMLLIRNQLVLVAHTAAVNGGPNYAMRIDDINREMHYLSTNNHLKSDYQLTPFSLKDWPKLQ